MEKTPITQMIEAWLDYQKESKNDSITIEKLIEVAKSEYLPKEKEVIEKIAIDMVNLSITKMENKDLSKGMEQEFNEYFEKTFTQTP